MCGPVLEKKARWLHKVIVQQQYISDVWHLLTSRRTKKLTKYYTFHVSKFFTYTRFLKRGQRSWVKIEIRSFCMKNKVKHICFVITVHDNMENSIFHVKQTFALNWKQNLDNLSFLLYVQLIDISDGITTPWTHL